jgi:hypothetical protein
MLAAQCPHRSQIAQRPGLEVGVADRPLEGDERIGGLPQLDVGAAGHHQAARLAERVSASRSQLRAFERRG